MYTHPLRKFCKSLYQPQYKVIFEDYQAHANPPVAYGNCPYPIGTQELKNFRVINADSFLPAYLPGSEKWKLEFRMFKKEKVIGGYNIYASFISNKTFMWN